MVRAACVHFPISCRPIGKAATLIEPTQSTNKSLYTDTHVRPCALCTRFMCVVFKSNVRQGARKPCSKHLLLV